MITYLADTSGEGPTNWPDAVIFIVLIICITFVIWIFRD